MCIYGCEFVGCASLCVHVGVCVDVSAWVGVCVHEYVHVNLSVLCSMSVKKIPAKAILNNNILIL